MKLSALLEELDPFVHLGVNRCCFRGQAESWDLKPKAYRPEYAGSKNQFLHLADSRLLQWEAEASTYLRDMAATPKSKWEWLAVAQHYGLATRVLDWTSNPLIAVFFAVIGSKTDDGELLIWSFDPKQYNVREDPGAVNQVVLYRPSPTFDRLRFQHGLLSFHPAPDIRITDAQLHKIKIPANSKVELQTELYRYGVHHESVFITPDHLAQKINWISTNHVNGA